MLICAKKNRGLQCIMDYDFTGKVAVISGGSSGMGKLTADNIIAMGGKAVIADLNPCEEDENRIFVSCDVREYAQMENVAKRAVERFGRIDYLCNFAGGDGIRILKGVRDFLTVDVDILKWEIDVNLTAQMLFARAVLPYMAEHKSGCIINLGSIAGAEASAGSIGYSTAKSGAMHGLTMSLAGYASRYGVRVNCVSPGPVLTRAAMAKMQTLLGRAAEPQEVVDLICYLLSDKAAFITGSNFMIDGGRTCMKKTD